MSSLVQLSSKEFSEALIQLGPQQFGALTLTGMQNNTRIANTITKWLNSYNHYWRVQCDARQANPPKTDKILTHAYLEHAAYYYRQSARQNQLGFDVRTYGWNAGVEIKLPHDLNCIVGCGYLHSNLRWEENAGCADIDSISMGSAVGYITNIVYADFVVTGSRTFYDVDRYIQFPGVTRNAHNNHKSWDLLTGLIVGLKLNMTDNAQSKLFFLPSYKIYYINIFEEGYREQGANK